MQLSSTNIVPTNGIIWSRVEEDVYLHEFLQLLFYEKEAPKKVERHRKINTARGPRDRRMRLSLDVAKRFFHLQDLLGYDKPSATVHWLLTNAASAIAQLHPTSTTTTNSDAVAPKIEKLVKKKKKTRVAVGRESRIKARERARERTRRRHHHTNTNTNADPMPIIHHQQYQYTTNYNYYPPAPSNFFTQDEQIGEFEFGGNPWGEEVFNTFHLSK